MKEKNKIGIYGIIGFVVWFLFQNYSDLPFEILNINPPTLFLEVYTILVEILTILFIFLLFKKEIVHMWKDFYENRDKYFKKYFKYWFLILILMAFSNGIITLINKAEISNNQEAINDMFKRLPIYTYILSVFLAPIIEELVFRFCFMKIFNNKYLYMILSGVIFGLFHIIGSFESAYDFLFLVPYSIPGLIFAYILYDSKNIFNTIWLHFVHNGISMLASIILLLA